MLIFDRINREYSVNTEKLNKIDPSVMKKLKQQLRELKISDFTQNNVNNKFIYNRIDLLPIKLKEVKRVEQQKQMWVLLI